MSTNPLYVDCAPRSVEWREARCGLVTASRAADVLAFLKKGGEKAERKHYRTELAIEILTGRPTESPLSRAAAAAVQWGIDQEKFARAAYELRSNIFVETCGFFVHSTVPRFGASPDGLAGTEGLTQFKCPATSTHINWMDEGVIPIEHAPQMLAELAVTGREWNDFVSFDPRLPKHLQLFIRRMKRSDHEEHIQQLEAGVIQFNAELDELLARLPGQPQPVVDALDYVDGEELVH